LFNYKGIIGLNGLRLNGFRLNGLLVIKLNFDNPFTLIRPGVRYNASGIDKFLIYVNLVFLFRKKDDLRLVFN